MSACCGPSRASSEGTSSERPPVDNPPSHTAATSGLEMVTIPAGEFRMGTDSARANPYDGESPVRTVSLPAFRIAPTCVTNAQFAAFTEATGHITDAEAFGWSYVFKDLMHPEAQDFVIDGAVPGAGWWRGVRGATWRSPGGPGSDIERLMEHPVVHVSYRDAEAFAEWHGMRLPTEAEWERAARGGLDQATYPWGNKLTPAGEHRSNIWQGNFPDRNTEEDGYFGTAPVDEYMPNGFGLYNTAGNVWEWTADWFSPTWHVPDHPETREDPRGPSIGMAKVVRGGSYLCHVSYCNRYRVGARTKTTPDSSLGHTGFRVAAEV